MVRICTSVRLQIVLRRVYRGVSLSVNTSDVVSSPPLLDQDKVGSRTVWVKGIALLFFVCSVIDIYRWWHLLVALNSLENFIICFFHCQLLKIGKSSRADSSRVGHGELALRTALIFLKEIVGLTWTFAGIQHILLLICILRSNLE